MPQLVYIVAAQAMTLVNAAFDGTGWHSTGTIPFLGVCSLLLGTGFAPPPRSYEVEDVTLVVS